MQPKLTKTIDRHLDEQLGAWTRLLPWRRELAAHLEQAYEAAQIESSGPTADDDAWQRALANFGDVREVASLLRQEHWPQYLGWRIVALVVSFSIVFSISGSLGLLHLPSLGFVLGPLVAFIFIDTLRGSASWAFASRIGIWGGICGTVLGMFEMLLNLGDPSLLGEGMALSILSALYCVLFYTPRRSIVIALVGITLVDFCLFLAAMHTYAIPAGSPIAVGIDPPSLWSIDKSFVLRVLAICCAGLCAGLARLGFHGLARHAASLGAGVFLVSVVVMLSDMSDPGEIRGQLLVALSAMVLAVACSHCASDSARLVRRLIS